MGPKDDSGFYRFADRGWLRHFEARHLKNIIQRPRKREMGLNELNEFILEPDQPPRRPARKKGYLRIVIEVAVVACLIVIPYNYYERSLPPEPTPIPTSPMPSYPPKPDPTPSPIKPSAEDLKEIDSKIEYPREDEYFSEYRYATVKAPGGHSVYGFGSADHAGTAYTVLDGEKVVILAERKGYSCVIVLSEKNRGDGLIPNT